MSVHWSDENSRTVLPSRYFHDRFSRSDGESGFRGSDTIDNMVCRIGARGSTFSVMKNTRPMRALTLAWAIALSGALVAVTPGVTAAPASGGHYPAVTPAVAEYQQLTASTTPPTEDQCNSVGRRCFNPVAMRAAYNLNGLVDSGMDGRNITIAIVDSYGSDTIAHDLHVYNTAFGLPSMCGEEGVTCAPSMPSFSRL